MNLKRFLGKIARASDIVKLRARASYAQVGEDLIIDYLFTSLRLNNITYLDIGANQPIICNNTYLFYQKGYKGVCIEPDVAMYDLIKVKRPNDTVLNIGIGLSDVKEAAFYVFPGSLSAWNTFSAQEAAVREAESGIKPQKVSMPLKTINDIIEQYFNSCPDFISLDVEGLDLDILRSLDFTRFKPKVVCVETISFSLDNKEEKQTDVIDFMHSKGYLTYADTHVNTIFCQSELFANGK